MKIPAHLREFVVEQHYDRYTPIDQDVWRYVMRQNLAFLETHAHESYVNGLKASGISVETIPSVEIMNRCLGQFGWGAVTVDGVIPATVFMDFQAHGLLPISADIRSIEHVAYTPAPDILHETAGHAPILHDETFARFVKLFGEIGARAFSSKADYAVYEATRKLSIIKEHPGATPDQVRAAEAELAAKRAAVVEDSEATMVGRLYWWTVEYGLIGSLDAPRLYGAGLLSSVGESKHCLSDAVRKLPFSLEACIKTDYDITNYQPQLFVCRDFEELIDAVGAFRGMMALDIGGTVALERALASGNIATVVYSSGLQVSGHVASIRRDARGEAIYFRTEGPTALAFDDRELPGQGRAAHADGFSAPIGPLAKHGALEALGDEALERLDLVVGRTTRLAYASGVVVEGRVVDLHREAGRLVLIGLEACSIRLGDELLYDPSWGRFDLPVGARIVSAYAGAADKERFHATLYTPSETTTIRHDLSPQEQSLHALFQRIRSLRETPDMSASALEAAIQDVLATLDAEHPGDWLTRLELVELAEARRLSPALIERLLGALTRLAQDPDKQALIRNGLALTASPIA